MTRRGQRVWWPKGLPTTAQAATGAQAFANAASGQPPRGKYRNVRTEVDGFRFDSKKEAQRYVELKALRAAGVVAYFLRQVPFHLPGNIRYVCDFLVVYTDGRFVYEDVKSSGTRTRVYINKRKQVLALYGVEIVEV